MKKILVCLALLIATLAHATTLPVQLLNPASSTAGQVPVSTGPTTPPTWGAPAVTPIAANTMLANPTGSTAAPQATTATSFFDAAYCNTVGYLIVRFTGAWTCAKGIAANPVWWGADPTGATSSTTAFNNAVAASLYVRFPPGTFLFATAPNTISTWGEHIEGSGETATTFALGYTTGNFLHLTGGLDEVDGFTVGPSSDMTSGAIIEADASQNYVHDIYSVNGYDGYWFTSNCINCFGNHLVTGAMTPHATASGGASFVIGTAGSAPPNQILLSNIVGGCSGADFGLNDLSSDSLQVINFELEGCAVAAMNLSPGSGSYAIHTQLVNGFLDQSPDGLEIAPSGTGYAQYTWATNVWAGDETTGSSVGIYLGNTGTGASSDFRCTSCELVNTTISGLAIQSTAWKNITITSSCIAGNTDYGIQDSVTANVVNLVGDTFGNCDGFGTNGTDIALAAGSSQWSVQSNVFNSSAKIPGATLLTGTNNFIVNNPGFNPYGGVTAPAVASSGTAVTNHFPFPVTVYISGTVSSVAIGSAGVYAGLGVYRLGPSQTITLGYSSTPSWIWVGD